MGQTSLHYLKDKTFNMIKLDGSLARGLFDHRNCREITSSIVQPTSSLHLPVMAECADNEQRREALHETGCDNDQDCLYSPAVFLQDKRK